MAEQRSGSRDANSERRRKLFSINDQIDKIQDVYFHNYTQNIDRRISALSERQTQLLDRLYDNMEKSERERIKRSFNDRQDAMRASLNDWREYNKSIRENLTLADKFAAEVFFWNRRRNLRDLEREARYRFDDIRDEAEDLAKDMSDSFSSVSDTLRDWATALNVNQLASGMEDTQKSMRDIRIEMQKYVNLNEEDWRMLRNQANEFSKSTDYAISNIEYLEKMSEILSVYNDKNFAMNMAGSMSKLGYFGVDASSLGALFEMSKGDTNYAKTVMSQMMRIQTTDGLFTNAQDLAQTIQDSRGAIQMHAKTAEDQYDMMQQALALKTASNASWMEGLDTKLYEIMQMAPSEMSYDVNAVGGKLIQTYMQSGDFKKAAQTYIEGLSRYLNQSFNSESARIEYLNQLGFTDTELQSRIMQGDNVEEFYRAFDQTMLILNEETKAADKFIDNWNNSGATSLEKLNNQFKTSKVGSFLDDIANELDITLAEAMLIGSGAIRIGQALFKGVKGLGNLFGLGGGGGTAAAAGAKSFLGFSSGGAGVINHAFLGSTGNAMVSGTGILGGLANAGSSLVAAGGGGAVAGGGAALAGAGSITGGVIGGASIIDGIVDMVNAEQQVTWQAKADQMTEGAIQVGGTAAAAAVGAAIGSIVPGVGTVVGALVGAGVGGLATLIWGDDWAQQLQDSLDGTNKIKKAIETLNKNSSDLNKALSRDHEMKDLTQQYQELRVQLDRAAKGTDEYERLQGQLNDVVTDINDIYPGYIDLNSQDYSIMDKQVEVTKKLADAELSLYRARILSSGDDIVSGVEAAASQLKKSQSSSESAINSATNLGAWSDFWTYVQTGLDSGKWSISGNKFVRDTSATDDEWNYLMNNADAALSSMNYYNKDNWHDWVHLWGQGDDTDLYGAWTVWNHAKGDLDYIFENAAIAQADVFEKDATLTSMLTEQIAQYDAIRSASSWDEVANNWATADPTDKSMLIQIGRLAKAAGQDYLQYLVPNLVSLESKANYDFTGNGTIGSFSHGIDRVPYDNFPAYLHEDEAVLTAQEADIWRSRNSGWAPNDEVETLSHGDIVIVHNEVVEEDDDDSTLSDVIAALKTLSKDLQKVIKENSAKSDANNQALLNAQAILSNRTRLMTSQSNQTFSFT